MQLSAETSDQCCSCEWASAHLSLPPCTQPSSEPSGTGPSSSETHPGLPARQQKQHAPPENHYRIFGTISGSGVKVASVRKCAMKGKKAYRSHTGKCILQNLRPRTDISSEKQSYNSDKRTETNRLTRCTPANVAH